MNLTPEAVAQIESEVKKSFKTAANTQEAMINSDNVVANKALILGFLRTLVTFIPGVFGKIAGQAIIVAAEAWFANKES